MKAAWKPEGFFPLSNRNLRVGTSQAMVLNQASWRLGRERQGHWLKACISGYLPAPEPPGKKGKVLVAQSRPTLCNPMNHSVQFQSLVREDPTCCVATKPMCCKY